MPKKTIDRINTVKGPYISRAKFILRAVDKALQEEEQREKEEETSAQCVTDWRRQQELANTNLSTRV